jgi:uncharacterized protein (DUF2345 family)
MTFAQIGRRAVTATSVYAAVAMLTACGGSLTAPNAAPPVQSGATSSARNDAGGGCPLKRCIIVTSQSGYEHKPLAAILFFARNANGNVKPAGEISGPKTTLSFPRGVAMDSQGNIYVSLESNTIAVYAAGSEGNVAPIRTIAGAETKLNSPGGLAVDSNDELYVANCPNQGRSRINVYARNANGDAAPIRAIGGSNTHLYCPWGVALDSQSNLYVANDDPNSGWITVYASGANGNVKPQRKIRGPATTLEGPTGIAVDAAGYIYVAQNEAVAIFSPDAHGDEAPISHFSSTLIYGFGIALDGHDNMYVTSVGYDDPPYIAVFAAGTAGNQGHVLRTIEGRKARLFFPEGIIVR